jgi:tetratricopeptide (TPR) repeat protein
MTSQAKLTELLGALESRDHARVSALIESLIGLTAPLGDRWAQLARAAFTIGEHDQANTAMALRARQLPGSLAARFDQVVMLAQTNRPAEALTMLAALPDSVPNRAAHWYLRGTLELNLGTFPAANEALERSHALNPASGQTILALAATCKADQAVNLIERLRPLAPSMKSATGLERACFHYALCKLYKDVDDHAEAFAQASLAGAISKPDRAYRVAQDRAHADGIVSSYSSNAITELRARCGDAEVAPIFILGLPRTGTTLLQQILASHSTVADGGEMGRIPILIKRMGGLAPQQVADYAARDPNLAPAALYARLARQYDRSGGIILDKSIENTRYAGLIKAIMPQSKLIWIRRDPMDSAWSVFSTYFTRSLNWSFDLEDIAAHYAIEQRISDHWAGILGEDVLQIDYEQLVRDSQTVIGRILRHCGLAREEGPFQHHRSDSPIATASVVQAREPIYQSSVSGSEPYRRYMQPFLDALDRELSQESILP